MTSFVALYHGQTVGDAKLIAVSADSSIVAEISKRLLQRSEETQDKIIQSMDGGRRSAIELIYQEASYEKQNT